MSDGWLRARAADLGRGIGSGRIDPRALADVFIAAIESHELAPRIYARTTFDRARAEAEAAADRAHRGLRRGLLDGVPVSWKDLFDTAGVATEAGSALLRGRVPARDAEVLARASRAGLVCLGKTHMSELAFSGLGLNPVTATPPCANDAAAVPGGSSSGAAASVAFGLAAAGIGSDTGGSVRLPAAWNDLVGFKTSFGLLPLDGTVPLCRSFDTAGPLCRSVEDAAHLVAAMARARPVDLAGAALRGRRFLVAEGLPLDGLRETPRRAFEAALDRLAAHGAVLVRREIPEAAALLALTPGLFAPEAWAEWGEAIEAAPELMFPPIRERFRSGREVSAAQHLRDRMRMEALRRAWEAATAGHDAVLMATSPILPPDAARLLADPEFYAAENLAALRNTRLVNLAGGCAVTLPTGTPSCGIMAAGPAGGDAALLRTAAAMEHALGAG